MCADLSKSVQITLNLTDLAVFCDNYQM